MFSDILTPLPALGVDFDVVRGSGPVIPSPLRTAADVAALTPLDDPNWEDDAWMGWDAAVLVDAPLGPASASTRADGIAALRNDLAPLLLRAGPGQKPTRALLLQTWAFARPVRGPAAPLATD